MKVLSTLYKSKDGFKRLLGGTNINIQEECLVRIYTAICTGDEAVEIASEMKEVLPEAHIVGASGSGIIYHGKQYDDETLIIVEQFDLTKVSINTHTFLGKSAIEVAKEISDTIEGVSVPLMHLLCGDHYYDIHNCIEEFNKLNKTTKLVGGIVGDILPNNIPAYVFTEHGIIENGIVTAALSNEELYVFNEVNIAHEPISPVYEVNNCDGALLIEIDHKPAVDWCREQFGMKDLKEYSDWQLIAENDDIVHFPMVLEGHGGASRFIKYDSASKKMSLYFSQINNQTKFRIGYTSPTKCVQECLDICHHIVDTPIESLFCYSCLFRKLYLGNCAQWELSPFANTGICGVFMMGEIGYIDGKNEFLNGSCSLVGVAEKDIYINPDFSVFEDLNKIKDDNQRLLSFVWQKQSTAMSKENELLIEQLIQQQKMMKQQLYVDVNMGLENTIKFAQDDLIYHFDKMCMVQIESSSLLVSRFGRQGYYRIIQKALRLVSEFASNIEKRDKLFYYVHNDSIVYVVANFELNQQEFMDIIKSMYDQFQFIKLDEKDEILINRFVVVLNQKDLLEKGLGILGYYQNSQTNFLIFDDNTDTNQKLEHEMEMIQILNQVIEKQKVIPYFQGVYDNEKKEINKYEALMRIEDENGKIYNPFEFMDIAKKYHLYSTLSTLMIKKVLTLFAGEKSVISINLSADDINLEEVRQFIYHELEQIGDASNIIFEILEDEEFRDMDVLRNFIDVVRQYGVKIAVDDFGSGYSNFIEIVKIEPDLIKVDGSIIRDIDCNLINQKVLENIVFLGNQLNANLVAEFVENKKIQERVEALGIRFSQGFYFSKPLPYRELGL